MSAPPAISIGLTGDVMLGRLVAESVERHGYAHPWGELLEELRRLDLLTHRGRGGDLQRRL